MKQLHVLIKETIVILLCSVLLITYPLTIHANQIDEGYGKNISGDTKIFNIQRNEEKYVLCDTIRNIKTYDAQMTSTSYLSKNSGILVESASPHFSDSIAIEAYTNMAKVYDYFKNVHERDSFDNHHSPIQLYVHVGKNLVNAYWSPSDHIFAFGDGNQTYKSPSAALDALGHEFTHAIIDHTAHLDEPTQSATLNESLCDIFGAIISESWEVGAFIGKPIRSLSDPTKHGQPDHFNDYESKVDDPYFNCGIHNKAAYLLAEGGTHYGQTVQGISREKIAKIYYHALTNYLQSNANFHDMREAAIKAAINLYGPVEAQSVKAAYTAVGIN